MSSIDDRNKEFWNQLCGSTLARRLGIVDDGAESLRKFDDWYLDFYPYLFDHIAFDGVSGEKVLEIGLGYGTVSGKLMESGTDYHGLDIAEGPVAMARHRAALLGTTVEIQAGSALAIPYADRTFDQVVTIGCLHHTGDLARAFREVARVIKPGGTASIMVYSAVSYRQWMRSPIATYRRTKQPDFDWANADTRSRRAYDANLEGDAAPSTTFISPREAEAFLGRLYSSVTVSRRNVGDDFPPARLMPRSLGRRLFESWLGLDLYINCVK
jgi:SAM-dependent methyltransferase